jgi:hypothetical protein
MSDRASIFDETDFDLSGFEPKGEVRDGGAPSEAVRAASEAAKFRSREPALQTQTVPAESPPAPSKREPRRYRTGRNTQLNIKVRAETLETFYAIADRKHWVLGHTLERALDTLTRELAAEGLVE